MIRVIPLAIAVVLLLAARARADRDIETFYDFVRSTAVELSKPSNTQDIERVRRTVQERMASYRFRGEVLIQVERRTNQADLRIDAERFMMIVLAERGEITFSDLTER